MGVISHQRASILSVFAVDTNHGVVDSQNSHLERGRFRSLTGYETVTWQVVEWQETLLPS